MYTLFSVNPNCSLRPEGKLSRGQDQLWGSKQEVSGPQKGMQLYLGDELVYRAEGKLLGGKWPKMTKLESQVSGRMFSTLLILMIPVGKCIFIKLIVFSF